MRTQKKNKWKRGERWIAREQRKKKKWKGTH
jgi:hypothetical protein